MPLDVFQQVFRLSLVSNGLFKSKGDQATLQRKLQDFVADEVPKTGEGWNLVWGPVVWKKNPENIETGPDNSWYIAFNPCLQFEDGSVHPTYVIAISGTPLYSQYAAFFHNFAVNTVSDFKAWVASGIQFRPSIVLPHNIEKGNAYIATGTVNGVHLLLHEPAPEGVPSAGTTLLDFIIQKVGHSASSKFIFTGHSLGGALSPSLALALVRSGTIPANRSLTYPTAGPSPGNIYFTELFVDTFPPSHPAGPRGYQSWNLNLVNTLDIVPQAWASFPAISERQLLQNIPTIYGEPAVPEVQNLVNAAILLSRASFVLYKPLPSQYFTGRPPPCVPENQQEFVAIFAEQHNVDYPIKVGVIVEPL